MAGDETVSEVSDNEDHLQKSKAPEPPQQQIATKFERVTQMRGSLSEQPHSQGKSCNFNQQPTVPREIITIELD